MNSSIFRNPRALLGGAIVAIILFFGSALVIGGRHYTTEAQPGSITVRPIVRDDRVKNITMSVVIALAGGVLVARAIHRSRARA